jgi:hypothetical protein
MRFVFPFLIKLNITLRCIIYRRIGQRSAQQNRSQKWVISREYGREKQGMPWTAPSPRLKRHKGHGTIPSLWRLLARLEDQEKAPCIHNEPVIDYRNMPPSQCPGRQP